MLLTMDSFCLVLFCDICVFCRLVVLVRLSAPVQVNDRKDSSMKWPMKWWWGLTHSLTHSLTVRHRNHAYWRQNSFIPLFGHWSSLKLLLSSFSFIVACVALWVIHTGRIVDQQIGPIKILSANMSGWQIVSKYGVNTVLVHTHITSGHGQ